MNPRTCIACTILAAPAARWGSPERANAMKAVHYTRLSLFVLLTAMITAIGLTD
jgi:hypothetical protein